MKASQPRICSSKLTIVTATSYFTQLVHFTAVKSSRAVKIQPQLRWSDSAVPGVGGTSLSREPFFASRSPLVTDY